ncbi:MAG: ABC transporter ATP-binding protein [Synergistes sp.]|nr:ABC transporter ATP-binding protein [Synergistes sp.]
MILEINDLYVTYNSSSNSHQAVRGVTFALPENSFCGLIGESGSGKSTVLMTLLGLLPSGSTASGSIRYCGREILNLPEEEMQPLRQREIALIPQGALNSFTPVMTIGRHIREVLSVHLGLEGEVAEKRISELLEEVELPASIASRYPHELSGGQKQRAAIALALSCDPRLILADEPTTALDVVTQAAILKLLERLRREKSLTVMLVTHDLPVAASSCDKLFVMKDGELIESGTPKELLESPRAEHTKALISAMLNKDLG